MRVAMSLTFQCTTLSSPFLIIVIWIICNSIICKDQFVHFLATLYTFFLSKSACRTIPIFIYLKQATLELSITLNNKKSHHYNIHLNRPVKPSSITHLHYTFQKLYQPLAHSGLYASHILADWFTTRLNRTDLNVTGKGAHVQ